MLQISFHVSKEIPNIALLLSLDSLLFFLCSSAVDDFFTSQKHNQETLKEFLGHYLSSEELDGASNSINEELTKLINKRKVSGKVILTGNLSNPFSFIKECDCYIMPSLHEGQPMAILEARMLKMPIIVSDFFH